MSLDGCDSVCVSICKKETDSRLALPPMHQRLLLCFTWWDGIRGVCVCVGGLCVIWLVQPSFVHSPNVPLHPVDNFPGLPHTHPPQSPGLSVLFASRGAAGSHPCAAGPVRRSAPPVGWAPEGGLCVAPSWHAATAAGPDPIQGSWSSEAAAVLVDSGSPQILADPEMGKRPSLSPAFSGMPS